MFEMHIAEYLDTCGVEFTYETETFPYTLPVRNHKCADCGSTAIEVLRSYTPDFFIVDNFIVEAKGIFSKADRDKMIAFRELYPDKDIRLLFYANRRLTRRGKKFYEDWAEEHGFKYYTKTSTCIFPEDWINECRS